MPINDFSSMTCSAPQCLPWHLLPTVHHVLMLHHLFHHCPHHSHALIHHPHTPAHILWFPCGWRLFAITPHHLPPGIIAMPRPPIFVIVPIASCMVDMCSAISFWRSAGSEVERIFAICSSILFMAGCMSCMLLLVIWPLGEV